MRQLPDHFNSPADQRRAICQIPNLAKAILKHYSFALQSYPLQVAHPNGYRVRHIVGVNDSYLKINGKLIYAERGGPNVQDKSTDPLIGSHPIDRLLPVDDHRVWKPGHPGGIHYRLRQG